MRIANRVSLAIDQFDRTLSATGTWLLVCLAVMALQLTLTITHRPWLDEWQALQIALQSPTLADLLENLRYEGHPPLWYLVLRGFALFMPWQAVLPTVGALIALVTQALILFRAPFSRAERLLLATSELMLFEYLTLSRSMSLGVLMLVLAVTLWRSRWVWLAIALLPMCDFLFGVLSACFVVLKWRERELWLPGVAAWIAVSLLAAWTVIPAPGTIPALWLNGIVPDFGAWITRMGTILFPFQTEGVAPVWNGTAPFFLGAPLCYFLVRLAWHQTGSEPWHRIVLLGFFGLTLLFSMTVYPLHFRHLSLAGLLIILLCWLQAEGGRPVGRWVRLWLVSMTACGLAVAAINFAKPFDTAHLAAQQIIDRGLANKHWLVFPDSRAQGVSALTGVEFERTEAGCKQQFIRWNHRSLLKTRVQFERYIRGALKERGQFYLLSDFDVRLPKDLAQEIARVPPGYNGQAFYLTLIGPGQPQRPVTLPRCVPNIRPLEAARWR